MNNLLIKLKSYRNGIGLFVIGIAAFFIINGNPLNDFRLMNSSVTVQGIATDVNDFEDREDNGNVSRYFFIKYEFKTNEGETIADVVEVPGNSTDKGFKTGQSLEIQYLPDAPNIHSVKALSSTSMSGWLLKNILFALLAIAPGCYMMYRSYQSESKQRSR